MGGLVYRQTDRQVILDILKVTRGLAMHEEQTLRLNTPLVVIIIHLLN